MLGVAASQGLAVGDERHIPASKPEPTPTGLPSLKPELEETELPFLDASGLGHPPIRDTCWLHQAASPNGGADCHQFIASQEYLRVLIIKL